jgi:hypothetical protein
MRRIKCFISVLILLCALFEACHSKEQEAILPQDQMSMVLTDMLRCNATAIQMGDSSSTTLAPYYQNSVLKHWGISFETYNKSIKYYSQRPVVLKAIVDSAVQKLNKE